MMFKNFKNFLNEIEDSSGSMNSVKHLDIDKPIPAEVFSLLAEVLIGNGENTYLQLNMPSIQILHKDLDISVEWMEEASSVDEKHITDIITDLEIKIQKEFDAVIESIKRHMNDTAVKIDSLESKNSRTARKYGIR